MPENAKQTLGNSIAPAPEHRLQKNGVTVFVLLPDARHGFYRGPRFDWSGMVRRVEVGGHVFFDRTIQGAKTGDPMGTDANAVGTAGEFGMTSPLGYDEAAPGETFVKIGVGELRRLDASPYHFAKPYPIVQPGGWRVHKKSDQVLFKQTLHGPRGWAYDYETTITLTPTGFVTVRTLRNRGSKPIATDHYLHHFVGVDEVRFGPKYSVTFPFAAVPVAPFKPAGVAVFEAEPGGVRLSFPGPLPPNKAMYGELAGFAPTPAHCAATVRVTGLGTGGEQTAYIAFQGDAVLSAFHVYATAHVLCPEPFTQVKLAPGDEMRWQMRYAFSSEPGP